MLIKNLEYWVLAQIALEVALVMAVGYFLVKLKSWGRLLAAWRTQEQQALAEMGSLTTRVFELEQRRVALEDLLVQANRKSAGSPGQPTLGEPGVRVPTSYAPLQDRGLSLRAQVEGLARQGFTPDDIARHLGLNQAEVKVALDLARVQTR